MTEIAISKRAANLSPKLAAIAANHRAGIARRVAAAEAAEAMAVALAQPHRHGSAARNAGDPLHLFVVGAGLRRECEQAGNLYGEIVRQEKAARGFAVVDGKPGRRDGAPLTPEQIEALKEAAILRLKSSNAILAAIHPRLPRRMELLCYDRLPHSPYDDGIIAHGLLNLARFEYGLIDEGINAGKVSA